MQRRRVSPWPQKHCNGGGLCSLGNIRVTCVCFILVQTSLRMRDYITEVGVLVDTRGHFNPLHTLMLTT